MRTLLRCLPADLARRSRKRLRRFLDWLAVCRGRSCERRYLVLMDDVQLKDLGLTRWEAAREAEKPFWRP